MAVRHEVENLIRRGNIFYWRPRVPAAFTHCQPGSRLSLSLHCSDHRKAQIIGRKLNMRLAELKMRPKEMMGDRERLQKLFEHIRDGMLSELEGISLLAKRDGRAGHVAEMELDLEAAWAYQLMAKFGARRTLTLEGNCSGLSYLLKNGVPASRVNAIKANHIAGLKVAQNPAVASAIHSLMVSLGIPDNEVNRERAMTKFLEARADALFDTDHRHELVDKSQSEFMGGSRAVAPTSKIEATDTPSPEFNFDPPPNVVERPPASALTAPPDDQAIAYFDLNPAPAVTKKTTPNAAEAGQRVVAVSDFEQECEKLIANMGGDWEPATARDALALVRMFKSVLIEHGVEHSGQVEQYHIGLLRQHLNHIPTNWGRSSKMRAMSAPDLRAEGEKLRKAAELMGTVAKVGLAPTTIRKHFGNLQHFLKHLKGHGFQIESWTFEGLRPKKPKVGEIRGKQYKPSPQDIAPIFSSPLYVGSRGHLRGQRRAAGQQVFHDSLYYLPILFTYLGPRRREFAGLHVDDIARDGDGYVIILRSNGIRRLKNIQSQRMLPMPEEMVRLGFIEYVQAIKKLGYATLFPDLFSDKTENDPGDRFYDTFVPIMQTVLGENMWERAIHAFRHGFADTLKQAGVSQDVIEDISGRLAEGNETSTRYTNPAGLPLMRSALQHYPIISSVIEPKPLQLLPWVEKRQPPPWAREGKK